LKILLESEYDVLLPNGSN